VRNKNIKAYNVLQIYVILKQVNLLFQFASIISFHNNAMQWNTMYMESQLRQKLLSCWNSSKNLVFITLAIYLFFPPFAI
jgi:hypothetical protein